MAKVVLLGLDGATFALLDPLLETGRLPNLAWLVRHGTRGPLRSTVHPLTPAAWTSAVTGLNPGKHGIYDFRRRRPGSYELELVNARRRDGQPLWSILSQHGHRVGVFNVPMTYPPDAVNGFLVSGMDTPGTESSFVYPPDVRETLLRAVPDYRIELDEGTDDEDEFLDRVLRLADAQARSLHALLDLYPDLDFLMAVFVATDRLYHTFWHYLDPTLASSRSPRARQVQAVHERVLRMADDSLGRLRAWAGDDATFILMSDHGFGPLEKDVYMTRFLLDAGFLRLRSGGDRASFVEAVDWQHTRAYSFGFFGNIALNLHGREPFGCVEPGKEAEDIKEQLRAALQGLRDPQTGEFMVDAVYRREDLYSGLHVDEAPDLLVVMRNYAYMTRDGYEAVHDDLVGPPMRLSKRRLVHTGNHRLDGVLVMAGPGVKAGAQIGGASIMDIAPTVLYLMGLPVLGNMDGHVLQQALTNDMLTARPPRRLLLPPSPVESPAQRQIAALAQRVRELEGQVAQLEQNRADTARYVQQLEQTVAEKSAHIAGLEALLRQREAALDAFQRTIFHRAYQRWQRMRGRIRW